ncbi:MAG TPA: hypothetical protein GX699_10075 [Firmicutes bacterium]|nr:hypothetical protein [Bacillota bacterium]
MTHYTRQEWESFAGGRTAAKEDKKMEEHLLVCDACLKMYLSFISPAHEHRAGGELSPQFTAQVMQKIDTYARKKKTERTKKRMLFYYAVAACLTLCFTSAGIFGYLAEAIPELKTGRPAFAATRQPGVSRFGWSDRLLDNTLHLLEAITPDEEVRE